MSIGTEQRLAAMKREVARLKEEWERAKSILARLGDDGQLAVPDALIARLEAMRPSPLTAPVSGVRA